ncbi:MAG: hypothetical protein NXI13_00260 [Proteobacteria bacterium]|nr:hypothetical protein [Pseudomonadota bacterium]
MSIAEELDQPQLTGTESTAGILRGRFQVNLSAPIPALDRKRNKAYRVTDNSYPESSRYAIVLDPDVPYRMDYANMLRNNEVTGTVDLLDYGAVSFGEMDTRFVFVFERPEGDLVFNELEGPIEERTVLDVYVPAIIETINKHEKFGFAHRGIRGSNLFFKDEARTEIILGESATTPAGSDQPTVFEPLESANAHEFGRGNGNASFDCYALGVLIVQLVGGTLPLQEKNPAEIFTQKLEQGSFALLTKGLSLSNRCKLLLSGLLHDDPHRRWDVEMLSKWCEIIQDRPTPGLGDRKGIAPIMFEDVEYDRPRLLAQAMTQKPKQACGLLEDKKLSNWVRNSLRDDETADRMAEIQSPGQGQSRRKKRDEFTTIAQVSGLLDPNGSLCFKDLAFAGGGGLGSILSYAFMTDSSDMKSVLGDLLENGILINMATNDQDWEALKRRGWLSMSLANECFDLMKKKDQLGFGLERCLYDLNPTLTCRSPNFPGSYISTVRQLIEIAEKKLVSSNGNMSLFDRHTAAFIASRSTGLRQYFTELSKSRSGDLKHTVSLLKLFAHLQNVHYPRALPGFCLWAETLLKPLISNIQSDLRREFVKQRFEAAKRTGSLNTLISAVDIERHMKLDSREYSQAIMSFINAERLAIRLHDAVQERKAEANKYGSWLASVFSIATLVTSMILSTLYFLGS